MSTASPPDQQTSHVSLGIAIGFSISSVFILIFIIICALKQPCKRNKNEMLIQDREESFLYLQRLHDLDIPALPPSYGQTGKYIM